MAGAGARCSQARRARLTIWPVGDTVARRDQYTTAESRIVTNVTYVHVSITGLRYCPLRDRREWPRGQDKKHSSEMQTPQAVTACGIVGYDVRLRSAAGGIRTPTLGSDGRRSTQT